MLYVIECVRCVVCMENTRDGKCVVVSLVVVELSERIRQFSRQHVIIEPLRRPGWGWCRNVPAEDGNNNIEHDSFVIGLKILHILVLFLLFILCNLSDLYAMRTDEPNEDHRLHTFSVDKFTLHRSKNDGEMISIIRI